MIEEELDPVGPEFYANHKKLPSDVLDIYERIIKGEVNRTGGGRIKLKLDAEQLEKLFSKKKAPSKRAVKKSCSEKEDCCEAEPVIFFR